MKNYMLWLLICLTLVLVFSTSGCIVKPNNNVVLHTQDTKVAQNNENTATNDMDSIMYPINEQNSKSLPGLLEIPSPNSDTGMITGKLLSADNPNEPYINVWIFLGSQISNNETIKNAPILVSISPDSDIHAKQALDGSFLFTDVIPGIYSLVLWTPMSTVLLSDATTDEFISVEVKAGQLLDLETIFVK